MMPLRDALAAVVPASLKRRHERWSTRRYARAVRGPSREYVRRHGTVVQRGPFAGTKYLEELDDATSYLVAKLTGAYEAELHGVISEWLEARPTHLVDVGCAEGYYAVGFARASPGTTVHAFDSDPRARERCAELARCNGVAGRVRLGAECTAETLGALPATGVALLADCEGCERALLDPDAQPRLRTWSMLVELHEFLDPDVTRVLTARFEATHDIEIIEGVARDPAAVPELNFLDPGARSAVLSERRPAQMRWAALRPRKAVV
jgi:hypothetical protein